ncbi:hypothetical protein SSPIM334S_05620 [Streptomyces spiroverticillatus]
MSNLISVTSSGPRRISGTARTAFLTEATEAGQAGETPAHSSNCPRSQSSTAPTCEAAATLAASGSRPTSAW